MDFYFIDLCRRPCLHVLSSFLLHCCVSVFTPAVPHTYPHHNLAPRLFQAVKEGASPSPACSCVHLPLTLYPDHLVDPCIQNEFSQGVSQAHRQRNQASERQRHTSHSIFRRYNCNIHSKFFSAWLLVSGRRLSQFKYEQCDRHQDRCHGKLAASTTT